MYVVIYSYVAYQFGSNNWVSIDLLVNDFKQNNNFLDKY